MREQFLAAAEDIEARAKLVKESNEQLAEILTDQQKSKWQEMLGEPADEELLAKIRSVSSRRR
jgi:hypothetical protein